MSKIKTIKTDINSIKIPLPESTDILTMATAQKIENPQSVILEKLIKPTGTKSLPEIIQEKLKKNSEAKAVIVISDNTRPVPYRGESGILWPVVDILLKYGVQKSNILLLVANGTHHELEESKLRDMLDERIFSEGIAIINHRYLERNCLKYLGSTIRDTEIYLNHLYVDADIKILTGLVESHFMAGVSGGRKSICPGLAGKETIYAFHRPEMLNDKNSCDLQLKGNPCHEEALEISRKAGIDFIINVTLNKNYQITGVFAGDLELAHQEAVEKLRKDVLIPLNKEYDIVITHAGYVGINHYQAAKAAVAAIPAIRKDGYLVLFSNNTDEDPIGSTSYKSVLYLLKALEAKKFNKLIQSPDWIPLHDQWQVQMWSKVFKQVSMDNFIYYSPQLSRYDFSFIPGKNGNYFIPAERRYSHLCDNIPLFIQNCLNQLFEYEYKKNKAYKHINIAFLHDGPYGILKKESL